MCRAVRFLPTVGQMERRWPSVGTPLLPPLRAQLWDELRPALQVSFLTSLAVLAFFFSVLICKSSLSGERLKVEFQESFFYRQ